MKGVDNLATEKNITMKQFNGTDYDTLYPKTKVEQVEGAYSQQQILSDATAALLGLGADAVPDNAFQQIKTLIDNVQSSANSKARVQTGSYVGTGTYGKNNPCSLTFNFAPKLVIIRNTEGSETGIFVYNSKKYLSLGGQFGESFGPCSQSNNTIAWYYEREDGSRGQLNEPRKTYAWVAIG